MDKMSFLKGQKKKFYSQENIYIYIYRCTLGYRNMFTWLHYQFFLLIGWPNKTFMISDIVYYPSFLFFLTTTV